MLKQNSVLLLGLWLIILGLFVKIPKDWLIWIYVLTGFYLIAVSIGNMSRQSIHRMMSHHSKADTFTDSPVIKGERPRERMTSSDNGSVNY